MFPRFSPIADRDSYLRSALTGSIYDLTYDQESHDSQTIALDCMDMRSFDSIKIHVPIILSLIRFLFQRMHSLAACRMILLLHAPPLMATKE